MLTQTLEPVLVMDQRIFPGISDPDWLITPEKGTLEMTDRRTFWESTGEVNTITWSLVIKYSRGNEKKTLHPEAKPQALFQ